MIEWEYRTLLFGVLASLYYEILPDLSLTKLHPERLLDTLDLSIAIKGLVSGVFTFEILTFMYFKV